MLLLLLLLFGEEESITLRCATDNQLVSRCLHAALSALLRTFDRLHPPDHPFSLLPPRFHLSYPPFLFLFLFLSFSLSLPSPVHPHSTLASLFAQFSESTPRSCGPAHILARFITPETLPANQRSVLISDWHSGGVAGGRLGANQGDGRPRIPTGVDSHRRKERQTQTGAMQLLALQIQHRCLC